MKKPAAIYSWPVNVNRWPQHSPWSLICVLLTYCQLSTSVIPLHPDWTNHGCAVLWCLPLKSMKGPMQFKTLLFKGQQSSIGWMPIKQAHFSCFVTLKSFSKDLLNFMRAVEPNYFNEACICMCYHLLLILVLMVLSLFHFGSIFVHFWLEYLVQTAIKFITLILINAPPYRTDLL